MAINVMIVDDSIFIRVLLKDILESTTETEIKVVASVSNGKEAIKEVMSNNKIDVITLDIKMPEMDGIETLKEIMKIRRIPVLMISSLVKEGARKTFEALDLGAIDFITKDNDESSNSFYDKSDEIRSKLIAASKSKVISYEMATSKKMTYNHSNIDHIVAIGSSTGGPTALRILMSTIPKEFNAPIVIAQHMPEGGFIQSLAEKLNGHSYYKVKEIENGEEVNKGFAYLCPGGYSVEVFKRGNKLHLVLTKKLDTKSVYRPSVNMLLASVARLDSNIHKTAIVLTGMGDDGAQGALAIHQSGGTVICESEKTAVIYGMPKKVAELNIPKHIADIDKIFKYINRKK
ncbi:chemotaxis-specific protein-glutamate methyltransferase CheB [Bacillus cereus]|uniref:chemotaxis-specific protein-glutamate methyltransferase CheB n=1 Tax=Bacillus cereus TaxID=1396 RepID=UPI003079E43A